jgi:hypothetical protein
MEADTPHNDQRFEISIARWAMWIAAFVVFLVVISGRVRYTEGDSRYALVASMALIEHGSLRLDPYAQELDLEKLNNGHYWMVTHAGKDNHAYYDYPVGTPVLAAPFVMVGRLLGMNPLQREDDTALQIGIAAILCAAIFLLLFRLANLYLGDWAALIFSLALVFGSSLTSTMGTALWSQNFQTVIVVLILLELAEWERGKRAQIRGAWLGGLLFAAYLCRPTSVALILPVFGYLAWRQRKALPWAVGVSAGLLLLFVLWSWLEMGRLLPRYYDPTSWQSSTGFWGQWLPLWFGPARGLWAFTPALTLVFGGWALRKVRLQPLHILFWAWIVVHTVLLARSQAPWGGWSYGPRFFTELVPGLGLVLLLMADAMSALHRRWRSALLGIFVVLSAAGIYIHTLQGLYNIETMAWNDNPNIDQTWKERRWDWRHPQFLASWRMRQNMIDQHNLERLAQQVLLRLPDDVAVLLGEPDPLAREVFAAWNDEDHFQHRQKLYNSSYALHAAGQHEFYFMRAQLPAVIQLPNVQIDSAVGNRLCLGQFLANNTQYEIVIAAKDDCSTGPALETRSYMSSIGSLLDSVKLRQSYVLHLKGGKVMHEKFGDYRIDYDLPGSPAVHVMSEGLFTGNQSSITVNGQEYSLNQRGMNVVVLDQSRRVVWSTNFDTHGDDHERILLLHAHY